MKRKHKIIVCFIVVFEMIIFLTGCKNSQEKKYYSDKNNFITEEARVVNIIYDEEDNSIYFWLTQIDKEYQSHTFIVEGENTNVLMEKKIFEKIELEKDITYTSAPGVFYNGDCMPIVSISYEDEELLSFEEGYENLMKLY